MWSACTVGRSIGIETKKRAGIDASEIQLAQGRRWQRGGRWIVTHTTEE
jgi:hypothetical protein